MDESGTTLTLGQNEQIEHSLTLASQHTGARIIPVISPQSGRYDRAEDLVGLWAAAVGLVLTWLVLSFAPVGKEFAVNSSMKGEGLFPVLASVIIGFGVGAVLATKIGAIRRLFIPKTRMSDTVDERAKQYFGEHLLKGGNSGEMVLVYVSVYEKTSRLLTDDKLKDKLSHVELESIRSELEDAVHADKITEGICRAVARTSELLAPHCPPKSADEDHACRSYVHRVSAGSVN